MRTRPAFPMILAALLTVAAGAGGAGAVYAQDTTPPVEAVPDCAATPQGPFPDICTHTAAVGHIFTADVVVKDGQGDVSVDTPYVTPRTSGALLAIYYAQAGMPGKSMWTPLPGGARGVYLSAGSILLPVGEWIASGLHPGSVVRVVLVVPAE